MILTLSHVALGGAIGAVLRHLTNLAALRAFGPGAPWGTLAVNVAGSFLMGVVFAALTARGDMRAAPFLMTGVLGGFTTFSAFSLDVWRLMDRGETLLAAGYAGASVILSILALMLGILAARGLT